MNQSKKSTVLVTGATGRQGGALARVLLKNGHKVRALTRKTDSLAARDLKKLGAEIFIGSFDDPMSLERALAWTDVVFVMGNPYEMGPEAETRQGIAVVKAAWTAGVKQIVYSSVAGADRSTGIPHFESKYKVEQYIREVGVPHTIVAPVTFMDNVLNPRSLPELSRGRLAMALPASRALQQISVTDIANFVAMTIEQRPRFHGMRIDIASDEITGAQCVEILSRVTGRKIEYVEIPLSDLRAMSRDFARMFEWVNEVGYSAEIPTLRRNYPEVGWHTFEEWARVQDWTVLQSGQRAA